MKIHASERRLQSSNTQEHQINHRNSKRDLRESEEKQRHLALTFVNNQGTQNEHQCREIDITDRQKRIKENA